jgi:hypothetical protein
MDQRDYLASCSRPIAGATRRCPVKPNTPLEPDQVNLLLLSYINDYSFRALLIVLYYWIIVNIGLEVGFLSSLSRVFDEFQNWACRVAWFAILFGVHRVIIQLGDNPVAFPISRRSLRLWICQSVFTPILWAGGSVTFQSWGFQLLVHLVIA